MIKKKEVKKRKKLTRRQRKRKSERTSRVGRRACVCEEETVTAIMRSGMHAGRRGFGIATKRVEGKGKRQACETEMRKREREGKGGRR